MITWAQIRDEIAPGWAHVVFRDPKTEEMAKHRGNICLECPFMSPILSHKYGKKCGVCGCPILAKIRSESSKCPKDKW